MHRLVLLFAAVLALLVPLAQSFSYSPTRRGGVTMDLETPNLRQASPFFRTSSSWGGAAPWRPSVHFRRNKATLLDDYQRSVRQAEASHGMPWRSSIDPTYQGNGPYYMAFWEWQMDFMKEHLTNLRAIPTLSSKGQDMSYVENTDDNVRMHTIQFRSDEYDLIRMTLLDGGNKTQVFTSLWYPSTDYNLPLLGVDFLLFNKVKHVCISDFQPIAETEEAHDQPYEHLMAPIRAQFPSLQGKLTRKFYADAKHLSNQMLLGRQDDPAVYQPMMQHDLPRAFQGYLQTHVNLVKTTPRQTDADRVAQVKKKYQAYDEYSSTRDPAHGLLARFFGQAFADDYVYDILFPSSRSGESSSLSSSD